MRYRDEDTPLFIAEHIVEQTTRLGIPYIFKGSYRKANRSRVDSFTGIGDEKALRILRRVRETSTSPSSPTSTRRRRLHSLPST